VTTATLTKQAELVFLSALTLLGLYLSYLLVRPYAGPILFAVVLAIIFYPLHEKLLRVLRNPSASALLTTLITLIATVLPLVLLAIALSRELTDLYQTLTMKSAAGGGIAQLLLHYAQVATEWIRQRIGLPPIDIRGVTLRYVGQASAAIVQFGAGAIANFFKLLVDAAITFLLLFFLFRDGRSGLKRVTSTLPMSDERASELLRRIGSTVTATFYGGLAVAAIQGTLAGLAFYVLGLQSAVLWGFVTAIASLLPVVGSATVWVPMSVVLLASGHWLKAVLLLGWGFGVVGLVDNLVRPLIVRAGTQLHMVFIFLSLLGGLSAFGMLGLFLGPVILSVTGAVIGMLRDEVARRNA
jgi:predicted PurR-regulated permease PerM